MLAVKGNSSGESGWMIMRMKRCDDAGVGGESKDELVDPF